MLDKIRQTSDFLASTVSATPEIGIITGTGLGQITEQIQESVHVPYDQIPNFLQSTTEGHHGSLVAGRIRGKSVMAMQGRFHLYEGYSAAEVTFPVRVMAMLGVRYLLIGSAAGGLHPRFEAGDLMVVTDHLNLQGHNPLRGPNLDDFGPRFPDMTQVYPDDLVLLAGEKARQLGISLREGVYAAVMGPSLETPAETRFIRQIGADAVGMSTVPEATVGVHCGLRILAIVVITNKNLPDCMEKTSLDDVLAVTRQSGPLLARLWEEIIEALGP